MPSRSPISSTSMALALLLLVVSGLAKAQEYPWETQTFDFGWNPYNDSLTQCRPLLMTAMNDRKNVQPSVPPYHALVWSPGFEPYTLNWGQNLQWDWTVNLPVGGPYMISLFDSNNAPGGTSIAFNVFDGAGSCRPIQLTPSTLNLTLGIARAQCKSIAVAATGGTPPYTLHVIGENYPPKSASFNTGYFNYTIDVQAGRRIFLGVTDANGQGAVAPSFVVSSATDNTCLTAAQTLAPGSPVLTSVRQGLATNPVSAGDTGDDGTSGGSSSPKAAIIGGVIGGAVLLLALIIAFLYVRRQRERERIREDEKEAARRQDLVAPDIEPFRVQPMVERADLLAPPTEETQPSWRDSHETAPSSSASEAALLAARRGDAKRRPPSGAPSPGATSSQGNTHTSDTTTSWFVHNESPTSRSPPLPPGAATPAAPLLATVPSDGDRVDSPPPEYTERPTSS